MKNRYSAICRFIVFFFLIFSFSVNEVFPQSAKNANVHGEVIDSSSSSPLSFASVGIYDNGEGILIDGNITDDEGAFSIDLPYGSYYAIIEFMGYEAIQTPPFHLNRDNRTMDLGTVKLETSLASLDEVVVEGQK